MKKKTMKEVAEALDVLAEDIADTFPTRSKSATALAMKIREEIKKKTPKPKVVVHVRGGCVTGAWADAPVNVEVFDVDNMLEGDEDEGPAKTSDEVDKDWDKKIKGLKEVY